MSERVFIFNHAKACYFKSATFQSDSTAKISMHRTSNEHHQHWKFTILTKNKIKPSTMGYPATKCRNPDTGTVLEPSAGIFRHGFTLAP